MSTKWGSVKNGQVIYVAFLFITAPLFAQQTQTHSIDFGIGINSYVGDLVERSGSILNPTPSLGKASISFGYNRYIDSKTFFNARYHFGFVEGSYSFQSDIDPTVFVEYPDVNRYFESRFQSIEASLNTTYLKWSFMHSYAGVGVGILSFEITDEEDRNLRLFENSRTLGEEYDPLTTYLPVRLGFKFFPDSEFNLIVDLSWNMLNSDYLDNIGDLGNSKNDRIFRQSFIVRYNFK